MAKLIVTSPEELTEIIENSIKRALGENKVNQPLSSETYLNLEQATKFLNLAKQTLYGLTSKRLIPFIKKGKKLNFLKSDLEKWLLEGKRKTISELNNEIERGIL